MTFEDAIKTMEVAIAEVEWEYPMEYAVAFEMAIKALNAQQEEEKNEPLTLAELRKMDGKPVWFETDYEYDVGWHICHGEYKGRYITCDGGSCYDFGFFVEGCIIPYRHPPKEMIESA